MRFFLMAACICCYSSVLAQTGTVMALQVGDKVPDVPFNLYNSSKKTGQLSDYRGKMLILDFWNTSCTSCIRKFPENDSLQKKFKGAIAFLLVNVKGSGDDEKRIAAFYKKYNSNTGHPALSLANVLQDVQLSELFPHDLIPHYVWISPQGIVRAITRSEQVTEENIRLLLNDATATLPPKIDLDRDKPLYSGPHLPQNNMLAYSIFIKGRQPGFGSGNAWRKINDTIVGRAITNTPILNMYQIAMRELYPSFSYSRQPVLEVKDPSKLVQKRSSLSSSQWEDENYYTIDLIVPLKDAGKLYQVMLEELNRYSDYVGTFEKRDGIEVLVIRDKER